MIISASRRTDIPAFYAEWFMGRIREGFLSIENPYNPKQVRRVSLVPSDVDCIVFWTRNPKPLMPFLTELEDLGIPFYFQYTITGYPRHIEKSVPNPYKAIETFKMLSDLVGKNRVFWRFDPILISDQIPNGEHVRLFEKIATNLTGHTKHCTISIVDMYKKTMKNVQASGIKLSPNLEAALHITKEIKLIADALNIEIYSCAEDFDLSPSGIFPGKCIDDQIINSISDRNVSNRKDRGQREKCGCVQSIDIGAYNTCLHGCSYCYATYNHDKAVSRFEEHKTNSPFQIFRIEEITEAQKQQDLF